MATLPTSEENARKILEIFEHFNSRSGEGIMLNTIVAVAADRNWRMDDIRDGLEWGQSNGWFQEGDNDSIKLTDVGFTEM